MPAQFLQAVVIGLARQVVEGVAEEVHIAPLEDRFGQDLADRHAKAGVIVGDHELEPFRPHRRRSRRKSFPDERLSRFPISTARIWRRPSQSTPMAVTNCLLISGSKVRALVRPPSISRS
jgi:hypothetical protein